MNEDDTNIGNVLLRAGKILQVQLEEAVERQTFMGHGARLGEILVEFGYCSRVDVEAALIAQSTFRNEPVDTVQAVDRLKGALEVELAEFQAAQDKLRKKTVY